MNIAKTTGGNKMLKISKKEWKDIGVKAKWINLQKNSSLNNFDTLKWDINGKTYEINVDWIDFPIPERRTGHPDTWSPGDNGDAGFTIHDAQTGEELKEVKEKLTQSENDLIVDYIIKKGLED
jgi:hypothetical protein